MKTYIIISILFILSVIIGCVEPKQRTLVVTDYVPANQVVIPRLAVLQQAAGAGDAMAQYEMGRLYADGLGVQKSHRKAMELWEQSAVQGYAPAQYSLGWMYFHGNGVMTDFKEGCRWMRAAAEQGIQEAIGHYNYYCQPNG